jgi:hypothetical protein
VDQYNVSHAAMGQTPLKGLVMTKRWSTPKICVAPRICAIQCGMWPCAIWEQSWNNYGNPFAKSFGWNNLEGVQKSLGRKVAYKNAPCVGMPTWRSQMKVQGPSLVRNFLKNMWGTI